MGWIKEWMIAKKKSSLTSCSRTAPSLKVRAISPVGIGRYMEVSSIPHFLWWVTYHAAGVHGQRALPLVPSI
jgi:hypothetical protein